MASGLPPTEAALRRRRRQRRRTSIVDALRGQGTEPSQLKLTLNSDGTLGFSAPGWDSMKLKSCQIEEYKARVAAPTILDMRLTF